jgi:hypothetical protein
VAQCLIAKNSTVGVFMCFVWISEQTAIISLYSINWLVFVTETECVYCAVRTESCEPDTSRHWSVQTKMAPVALPCVCLCVCFWVLVATRERLSHFQPILDSAVLLTFVDMFRFLISLWNTLRLTETDSCVFVRMWSWTQWTVRICCRDMWANQRRTLLNTNETSA